MAIQPGLRGQQFQAPLYDASGKITTGGTPQLVMPNMQSMTYLFIQNLDATNELFFEFGSARATATLTNGVVTSCTVTNGGFGFTYPPIVQFLGGGTGGNAQQVGYGVPSMPAPGWSEGGGPPAISGARPATALAVLTGGVVTSIVIEDGGAGYVAAPYVWMRNSPLDPVGCANPFFGSTTSGIQLNPGGSQSWEASVVTTDQIAVYGGTTGQKFTCKFMP